jgi:hypothetical protein
MGRVLWLFRGFLCGSPRLCWLRTERLVRMSKYWMYRSHADDMGPVNLIACCGQMFGLSTLLQWLCQERNWGGSHGPLNWARRWSREHFFSVAVNLSNSVGSVWKVGMYGDRPQETYTGRTWTGVESVHGVLVGFSPAGCTLIRIAATLGFE